MDPATRTAYLRRLGFEAPPAPDLAGLRALHRAHLLAVPFENLDIHDKVRIEHREAWFLDKVVRRGRGGFCYELNGAFAALLRDLGFRVDLLSARVPHRDGALGPPFDHLALLVHLERPRVADVGFGEGFREPLALEEGEQQDPGGTFRVSGRGPERAVERRVGDAWKVEFALDLQPRALDEFAPMCHYHQTSPDSHFTQGRLWSLATPDGRITWSKGKLIETRGGVRSERPMDEAEMRRAFRVPP